MIAQNVVETISRFKALNWHDAELFNLAVIARGKSYVIECDFNLITSIKVIDGVFENETQFFKVKFHGCHSLKAEVSFHDHRAASYQIYNAFAHEESAWKNSIATNDQHFDFSNFIHFHIDLCPHFGDIDILATDFELEAIGSNDDSNQPTSPDQGR